MLLREVVEKDLPRIVEATADLDNDLRAVTLPVLRSSYAMYGICSESRESLIGFARQVEQYRIPTAMGEVCLTEIGTLWVEPEHRARGVGSLLIKLVTAEIDEEKALPLAVCNEISRISFAKNGFEEIGDLAPTARQHKRVVMINRDHERWEELAVSEVTAGIQELSRFKDLAPHLAMTEAK